MLSKYFTQLSINNLHMEINMKHTGELNVFPCNKLIIMTYLTFSRLKKGVFKLNVKTFLYIKTKIKVENFL